MLKLVAFSKKRMEDFHPDKMVEDRKKSQNMVLAIAVAQDILEQTKTHFSDSAIDLIFCTGEGEIAQTFEFYKNLANGERARPVVFQNSLHNSTLGALSLAVANISSGITVSNGDISFEMALDLALTSTSKNPILIVGADVYVDKVFELRKKSYEDHVDLVSGACAGFFIPHTHPLFDTFSEPTISDITIESNNNFSESTFSSYYPANGLEGIFEGLKHSSHFSLNRPKHYQVHINA
jgi:hypothetical protein